MKRLDSLPVASGFPTLLVAIALAGGSGCNRKPEPEPVAAGARPSAATAPSPVPSPAQAPAQGGAAELAWDPPAAWSKVENPSPMRRATFKLPTAAGDPEAPELAISIAGGSVDANVDRWVGQFDAAAKDSLKRTTRTIAGFDVTIVHLEGEFQGGGMPGAPNVGGPKPGWAMLAAIVPVGPEARWFFKILGPAKSVAAVRPEFESFLGTLRQK
jgi:hypothetical protein